MRNSIWALLFVLVLCMGAKSFVEDVDIKGTLKAAGLTYPSADGTAGKAVITNGSGTLSLGTPVLATNAVNATNATSATSALHATLANRALTADSVTDGSSHAQAHTLESTDHAGSTPNSIVFTSGSGQPSAFPLSATSGTLLRSAGFFGLGAVQPGWDALYFRDFEEWDLVGDGADQMAAGDHEHALVANATTAVYATSSTYATLAGTAATATEADSATRADSAATADWATSSSSSSHATLANRASLADAATYATAAGSAVNATYAAASNYSATAGSVATALSANYATSAGYALTAGSAGAVTTATYALTAGTATTATYALTAGRAATADAATSATSALNAVTLSSRPASDYLDLSLHTGIVGSAAWATYADSAGAAETASRADTATTATVSRGMGWTPASSFSAQMPSSATLTMTADLTGTVKAGMPARIRAAGTTYYALVTAVAANLVTLSCPAGMHSPVTALAFGPTSMTEEIDLFVSGDWGDGTNTALLDSDMKTAYAWRKGPAYLVFVAAANNSAYGATQPKMTVRLGAGGDQVLSATNALQPTTAKTFVSTAGAAVVDASKYDLVFGDAVEIECTAAKTGTAGADLTVQLIFVKAD